MRNITFVLFVSLLSVNLAFAHTASDDVFAQISSLDLGVQNVGLLPTNPFYFVKEWARAIRSALIFNPVAKTDWELRVVNQKAAELTEIAETMPGNTEAVERAFANYQKSQRRLQERIEALAGTSENPNVDALLEGITERMVRHEMLFHELQELFADHEALRMISESAQERVGEILRAAFTKDASERFIERLEAAGERLESLEALERLQEYLPEEAREQILNVRERLRERMRAPEPAPALPTPPVRTPAEPTQPEEEKPEVCILIYAPVCGTDGKTYSNSCFAGVAGVAIAHEGECEVSPKADGVSPEEPSATTTESTEPVVLELTRAADDSGFYPAGDLEVPQGARVRLTFNVRSTNVYFGGLDFRSPKFNTAVVQPGGSTTVEFIADESFMIESYWPASGVLKSRLNVIVR